MVGAIGSEFDNLAVSVVRAGHGNTTERHHASADHSGGGRSVGGSGLQASPPTSRENSQAVTQSEAFERVLSSIAVQIVSDAMAEVDDAMDETEDDA